MVDYQDIIMIRVKIWKLCGDKKRILKQKFIVKNKKKMEYWKNLAKNNHKFLYEHIEITK